MSSCGYSGTEVRIAAATLADLPGCMSCRYARTSSTPQARPCPPRSSPRLLGSPAHQVITVRLTDRFGDDGLVGGAILATGAAQTWRVPLLMMSCRALGRGVVDALLTWICRTALAAGASRVALPCVINPRNVPLRIALTGAGFRTSSQAGPRSGRRLRQGPEPAAARATQLGRVLMADLAGLTGELRAAARRTDGRLRAARRSA